MLHSWRHGRLSFSSACSSDDVQTSNKTSPPPAQATDMNRSRQSSTCSERSCEATSVDETRQLWRCMLELQLRYGCYNSARIDMALSAGDDGYDLMPNRFIIDVLNDSVIDMPDEGRQMLDRCLSPNVALNTHKHKHKFWRR